MINGELLAPHIPPACWRCNHLLQGPACWRHNNHGCHGCWRQQNTGEQWPERWFRRRGGIVPTCHFTLTNVELIGAKFTWGISLFLCRKYSRGLEGPVLYRPVWPGAHQAPRHSPSAVLWALLPCLLAHPKDGAGGLASVPHVCHPQPFQKRNIRSGERWHSCRWWGPFLYAHQNGEWLDLEWP